MHKHTDPWCCIMYISILLAISSHFTLIFVVNEQRLHTDLFHRCRKPYYFTNYTYWLNRSTKMTANSEFSLSKLWRASLFCHEKVWTINYFYPHALQHRIIYWLVSNNDSFSRVIPLATCSAPLYIIVMWLQQNRYRIICDARLWRQISWLTPT